MEERPMIPGGLGNSVETDHQGEITAKKLVLKEAK